MFICRAVACCLLGAGGSILKTFFAGSEEMSIMDALLSIFSVWGVTDVFGRLLRRRIERKLLTVKEETLYDPTMMYKYVFFSSFC